MKQVQILGTSGNKYNTNDGLKTPIGNGQHRVGSVAWCDGDYLLGGQQFSNRVPYIPTQKDVFLELYYDDAVYQNYYRLVEITLKGQKVVRDKIASDSYIEQIAYDEQTLFTRGWDASAGLDVFNLYKGSEKTTWNIAKPFEIIDRYEVEAEIIDGDLHLGIFWSGRWKADSMDAYTPCLMCKYINTEEVERIDFSPAIAGKIMDYIGKINSQLTALSSLTADDLITTSGEQTTDYSKSAIINFDASASSLDMDIDESNVLLHYYYPINAPGNENQSSLLIEITDVNPPTVFFSVPNSEISSSGYFSQVNFKDKTILFNIGISCVAAILTGTRITWRHFSAEEYIGGKTVSISIMSDALLAVNSMWEISEINYKMKSESGNADNFSVICQPVGEVELIGYVGEGYSEFNVRAGVNIVYEKSVILPLFEPISQGVNRLDITIAVNSKYDIITDYYESDDADQNNHKLILIDKTADKQYDLSHHFDIIGTAITYPLIGALRFMVTDFNTSNIIIYIESKGAFIFNKMDDRLIKIDNVTLPKTAQLSKITQSKAKQFIGKLNINA